MTLPAARRSASADRTWSSAASGPTTVIAGTSARIADLGLGLRLAHRRERRADGGEQRGVAARRGSSSAVGQRARCTEPSCHHDQTSSVTNGRTGANRRSSDDERDPQRGPGDCGRGVAPGAVGPVLDQLEVVVAERPEELLGPLERRV